MLTNSEIGQKLDIRAMESLVIPYFGSFGGLLFTVNKINPIIFW